MTTALYRRYRPDTFAEVIGQEHVTEPLMQALRTGKVTHAYLFSGPRGCGKTTSARILARCLNCAQGPTATPCGECDSCVELARGGAGSLDVVEIDAASHNGVDDARDLRERAAFAPARDRFKVFILDEAHMVTPQGFNALLKIVEEPPPHVKFIFATTEPDKVIGTIRSRTHHYPFRLVPPDVLTPYLDQVCAAEQVPVGPGVLPLVVRAGGGSVRDSMSVLDQLVAGADERGLDYERAVALLGFTHATLLDDAVDAIAVRDGASAFRVVDRVISSGHEPRRFVEDLLERLRDLIVIAASGEAARAVLRDVPADQLDRMAGQAATLGPAELSRSADLVNGALTEMTGATSPRLHLELLVARLLLPGVDDGTRGLVARLEKLERDVVGGVRVGPVSLSGTPSSAAGAPVAVTPEAVEPAPEPRTERTPGPGREPERTPRPDRAPVGDRVAAPEPAPSPAPGDRPRGDRIAADEPVSHEPVSDEPGSDERVADEQVSDGPSADAPVARNPASGELEGADEAVPADDVVAPGDPVPTAEREPLSDPAPEARPPAPREDRPAVAPPAGPPTHPRAETPPSVAPTSAATGGLDAETVRRRWPEVLQTLKGLRMATWVLVSQNGHVAELAEGRLSLAFTTPQLAGTFRTGNHADHVKRALHETLGLDVRIETTIAGDATAPAAVPAEAPGTGGSSPRRDDGDRRRAISAEEAAASWDAPAPRTAAPTSPAEGSRTGTTTDPRRQDRGGSRAPERARGADSPSERPQGTPVGGTGPAAAAGDEEPPPPWDIPPPEEDPFPDEPPPDPSGRAAPARGGA
ncbi:DNA polymerase III subunit gamma/tau, partial [Actinotalea ferrariae CF5-4]